MEGLEQRSINVAEFIENRSAEIIQFKQFLDSKKQQSNKLALQNISKQLRRRTASHNRYRIQQRVRAKINASELDVIEKSQDPIKCRKHLRRSKLLMTEYQHRSKKYKWLETHLWHSKRMHMIPYFGYKVAESPNDKSDRASYRFAKNQSILYDRSYYTVVVVKGETKSIVELLKQHLSESDSRRLASAKVLEGQTFLSDIEFYAKPNSSQLGGGAKSQLVGPVSLAFRPQVPCEQERSVMLLAHPGCREYF